MVRDALAALAIVAVGSALIVTGCGSSHDGGDSGGPPADAASDGDGGDGDVGPDASLIVSDIAGMAVAVSDATRSSRTIAHACAWTHEGRAYCWGSNTMGQLGDGSFAPRHDPVRVAGLEGVVGMVATSVRSCAWRSDGGVFCWGLLDGERVGAPMPVPDLGPAEGMASIGNNGGVCAWRPDGSLRCANALGTSVPSTPTEFQDVHVEELMWAAGGWVDILCARLRDGTLRCTRDSSEDVTVVGGVTDLVALDSDFGCVARGSDGLWCWEGASPTGPDVTIEPVAGFEDAIGFAGSTRRVCAWNAEGRVRCLEEGIVVEEADVGPAAGVALSADGAERCWWGEGRSTHCPLLGQPQPPTLLEAVSDEGVVEVAAGERHTCARSAAGGVFCWGDGLPVTAAGEPSGTPALVDGLRDIAALGVGMDHACAVEATGGVQCWGENTVGQLGDGTRVSRGSPRPVTGLADAVSVALGQGFTCALHADGRASCWGQNDAGQLGNVVIHKYLTPVEVPGLPGVTALAAPCALVGGEALCAGIDGADVPTAATTLTDVDGVTPQCAWRRDGRIECWSGVSESVLDGAAAGVPGIAGLATSYTHACAWLDDGTAKCWGSAMYGELGTGITATPVTVPTTVPGLVGVVGMTTGLAHSCARLSDGTARCWGSNGIGQLGIGATSDPVVAPTAVAGLTGVVGMDTNGDRTCAWLDDATVRCWGDNRFPSYLGVGSGLGAIATPREVVGLDGVVSVSMGSLHRCAVRADGSAWCWGQNEDGALGDGTRDPSATPVPVVGLDRGVVEISAGEDHTCARLDDGTVRCVGGNELGAIGVGTAPVPRVTPRLVPGGPFVTLAAGSAHACGQHADGRVSCWGDNTGLQLGSAEVGAVCEATRGAPCHTTPVDVVGLGRPVAQLALRGWTSCALIDLTPWCWGRSGDGQLGTVAAGFTRAPTAVVGVADVVSLSMGLDHGCAVDAEGQPWCWGRNDGGQLGDLGADLGPAARRVEGLPAVAGVTAGGQYGCAWLSDGRVYCWGDPSHRALGIEDTRMIAVPAE